MRLYLAAPRQWRDSAIILMVQLETAGFTVTSSWLRGDPILNEADALSIDHFREIEASDVLVLLNPSGSADTEFTGGRHTEFGYALKAGKRLIVVGARTQVFHYRPEVQVVTSAELLLAALRTTQFLSQVP